MNDRMLALFGIVLVLVTSCGISGDSGGGNPSKTELEIRDVRVEPTDSSAVVRWRTSMETVGTLSYGRAPGFPGRNLSSSASGDHAVSLGPLDPDTPYWYQITAATPLGARATTQPDTFRTHASYDLDDTTPPQFRDLRVVGLTSSSATVLWATDDKTIGDIAYGLTDAYGLVFEDRASYSRSHSAALTGLTYDQDYHLRVLATNRAGLSVYSDDVVFHTAPLPTIAVPDTVWVAGNVDFQFAVSVRDVSNLAAMSVRLLYHPDVVQIVSHTKGDWFQATQGHLLLVETDDPERGIFQLDASWNVRFENGVAVGTFANGGGDVAVIRARAIGQGARSFLTIDNLVDPGEPGNPEDDRPLYTRLLDHNRDDLRYSVRNGVVVKTSK